MGMLSERSPVPILMSRMSSKLPTGSSPVDLSVPIRFDGSQPAAFGLPRASCVWAHTDDFSGHVADGASCNVETLTITPHAHGTHTECVGHITHARISLVDVWRPAPLRALLVTVRRKEQERGPKQEEERERYGPPRAEVSLAELAAAARTAAPTGHDPHGRAPDALILRTRSWNRGDMPHTPRRNSPESPRPLSEAAAAWIRASGFRHLLIDAPSVDPVDDGGRLAAHRAFWGLAPGSVVPHAAAPGPDPLDMTITELIRVPDGLKDGFGWLDLQIPPFDSDAAPSRPLFYPDGSGPQPDDP